MDPRGVVATGGVADDGDHAGKVMAPNGIWRGS
jgi:hypothetical protein